ncbi:MAG: protein-L-isoaspartate(D-aspartate) O-methyltransferase [Acidobacteria bacterium]|nr:protein-L-isoaspartate(D-aspartate) O-methyltransferase [Acidobacteriota bacterium]MBI3655231.1 protein-L-isoaspartate(D-aspartate) O-methyltransferase [Acidobacteriota bacterium]
MNETNGSDYVAAREKMIRHLVQTGKIQDARVIEAMRLIPRHLFVEPSQRDHAYEDHPITIGHQQTISQPYMVARMTELLELTESDKVLEVGTGSGYQTAILAHIAKQVYSIERITELAQVAEQLLASLSIANVLFKVGDGSEGWDEASPFQAIMVTASAPSIPAILVGQMAVGGRMVIPTGTSDTQRLMRVLKREYDTVIEDHGGCVFVRLYGKYGWDED